MLKSFLKYQNDQLFKIFHSKLGLRELEQKKNLLLREKNWKKLIECLENKEEVTLNFWDGTNFFSFKL